MHNFVFGSRQHTICILFTPFVSTLDPNQDGQEVGPDPGPNLLQSGNLIKT